MAYDPQPNDGGESMFRMGKTRAKRKMYAGENLPSNVRIYYPLYETVQFGNAEDLFLGGTLHKQEYIEKNGYQHVENRTRKFGVTL